MQPTLQLKSVNPYACHSLHPVQWRCTGASYESASPCISSLILPMQSSDGLLFLTCSRERKQGPPPVLLLPRSWPNPSFMRTSISRQVSLIESLLGRKTIGSAKKRRRSRTNKRTNSTRQMEGAVRSEERKKADRGKARSIKRKTTRRKNVCMPFGIPSD